MVDNTKSFDLGEGNTVTVRYEPPSKSADEGWIYLSFTNPHDASADSLIQHLKPFWDAAQGTVASAGAGTYDLDGKINSPITHERLSIYGDKMAEVCASIQGFITAQAAATNETTSPPAEQEYRPSLIVSALASDEVLDAIRKAGKRDR